MTSPRPGSELIHCANRTLDFFRRDKNLDEDDNRIITLILVEVNRGDLSLAGFILRPKYYFRNGLCTS